ncbi:Rrf2 family transcriptional regulator [Brachyspira sp.]|uniref:RrF2 family transcriptional regulator n=1 Tax=Brachyspira sp. TaxID=1977261 RepID=UPI00262ABE1A|nr:Rrf2 family transcriptional regulator [Brachyspira sp.]
MIQISEASAIALHSMIYISIKEFASLKDIAERFDVSSNHLSKVLQALVKAGYLTSSKGPAGGFKISEGMDNTSFLEIYEAIEGKNWQRSCLFHSKADKYCSDCIMGDLVNDINRKFKNYMESHTIKDHYLLDKDFKINKTDDKK